jgi:hypothetical protein
MNTRLVEGAAIPDFDRRISAWLQRMCDQPSDDPIVWRVGIRNHERRIYRHITTHGVGQSFEVITFFDKSGFSALPVEFAQEMALDYVYHYDDW